MAIKVDGYEPLHIIKNSNSLIGRIASFAECTSNISHIKYATAGFSLISGKIKCAICSLEVSDTFNESQNLIIYHQTASGNCSFDKQNSQNIEEIWKADEIMAGDQEMEFSDKIIYEPETIQHKVAMPNPYKDERKRYQSLINSKCFNGRAAELARAGFFLANTICECIRCFACSLNIVSLKNNDNPKAIHQKLNPECSFINKIDVGNIPYDEIQKLHCNSFGMKLLNPYKMNGTTSQSQARYPDRSSLKIRLNTFVNYPATVPINVTMFAAAGFFYEGDGDQVVCFHCGLLIKMWSIDDDPWIEHARWNQSCLFVLRNKGKSFVNQAIKFVHALEEQKRQTAVQAKYRQASEDNIEAAEDIPKPVAEFLNGDVIEDLLIMGFCSKFIKDTALQYYRDFGNFPQRLDLIALLINNSDTKCEDRIVPIKNIDNDFTRMRMTTLEDSTNVCSICYEYPPSILFLGCGHLTACEKCSASPKLLTCPICRVAIKGTVKVFFPN